MRNLILLGSNTPHTKSIYVDLSLCVIEVINSDSPEASKGLGYVLHTPSGLIFSATSKQDIQSVETYINENIIIPIWPKQNNPVK